ncbi:hypothetical protein Q4610_01265 [Sphingobium sp. HBC34]|uniref:Uncharacterized protein n=1 Tax=Sphingobium cyanobacteriorum TaxID=3063954 RepID=A0ABT8ZHN6_9SPHN|nr:hypothetical protein [Sphingobium sp. HBC34]MDO7833663.1 hypothetical protein [Sphingobium sp. HBC34]
MALNILGKKVGTLRLEDGGDLIFYGDNELPSHETILSFLESVGSSHVKWKLPSNYVIRELRHLEGWMEAFLRVERLDLSQRFRNAEKSYEAWVIGDRQSSEVDIVVRLKTRGLAGHTEYRISVVKLDDDEYLCVE